MCVRERGVGEGSGREVFVEISPCVCHLKHVGPMWRRLYSSDARHLVFFPPPPAESRASTLDTKRWNEQVARRRSQGHLEMLAASTLRSDHHLTDAPPDYTRSRSMSDGAVMTQLAMHDHMTIFEYVQYVDASSLV